MVDKIENNDLGGNLPDVYQGGVPFTDNSAGLENIDIEINSFSNRQSKTEQTMKDQS